MIFKIIFISIFSILLLYSLVRPFYSLVARWFLMIGSALGILSIVGVSYTQVIANFLGIGRGADLYLYLSLVTIFLFVTFTINRFDALNKKISLLVKELALTNQNINDSKKD
jgi:small membrane protein